MLEKGAVLERDILQEDEITQALVGRILLLMERNKMTGKALSHTLGLAQSAVTDWKAGRSRPTLMHVAKMSILFGVTTDYLLFGKTADLSTFDATLLDLANKASKENKTALINVAAVFAYHEQVKLVE